MGKGQTVLHEYQIEFGGPCIHSIKFGVPIWVVLNLASPMRIELTFGGGRETRERVKFHFIPVAFT